MRSYRNLGSLNAILSFVAGQSSQRETVEEGRNSTLNSLLLGRTGSIFVVLQRRRKQHSQAPLSLDFGDESEVRYKNECLLKRDTSTHQILGGSHAFLSKFAKLPRAKRVSTCPEDQGRFLDLAVPPVGFSQPSFMEPCSQ